ncbi:hypothetical protein Q3G72_014342 [Acer saccharum]|nr:hypothetical protein Q3G72_014342 [Acer saccharum]
MQALFMIVLICVLGAAIFQGDPNLLGPILLCDTISYYAPFIHLVLLFLLWSLTIVIFDHDNINYTSIFDLDPDQNYLTAKDILVCAGWMILVLEPVLVVQLYISSDVAQAAAWLPEPISYRYRTQKIGEAQNRQEQTSKSGANSVPFDRVGHSFVLCSFRSTIMFFYEDKEYNRFALQYLKKNVSDGLFGY